MAEQGKITISVGVDSGNAIDGLKDLQDGLKDMGDASGKAGQKVEDSFDDIDKAAKNSAKIIDKSSATAQKAMKETAKVAEKSGSQTTDALDQRDTIDGLDGLKDKTGELDSSLKGLGGAVGLVSPEMERLLFVTGELSGGVEAASRLTTLAGGSMKSLMVAGGALGVAVGALGGAWMLFSRKVKNAEETLAEAHQEMVEGIAFAKEYQHRIKGLENSIGLLTDEEFALLDARKQANEFMKTNSDEAKARRSVVNELKRDLEGLKQLEQDLANGIHDDMSKFSTLRIEFRNIGEMVELTNEQIKNGEAVLSDNGLAQEIYNKKQILAGEALARTRAEITQTETSLNRYQTEVDTTREKTERLSLMLQIQAAQSREDNVAIRNLAMAMALLGDAQATASIAAINAAKGMAIMQTQMLGLGPAAGVAIAQIERMYDRLIDQKAPSAFRDTFEKMKIVIEDDTDSIEDFTAAIQESETAIEESADASNAGERAADMLAQARGEAAVIERDYAKAIMEVNALRVDGAITEDETTELIVAALGKRKDAIDELKRKQEELANSAKIGLQEYGKMASSVGELTGNALALIAQDIDEREAQALAGAEGNLEKQAQIEERFNAERAAKMTQLFKLQQGAAIAGAIINGAQAAVAALAPPPVGFGPQIGLAMMPILAGIAATEVALIANQKPSFHQGGMISGQGDQMITAQGGEAVLNKAAVAGLGGQSGVDSLNAGGGAGGAVVVQMVYKQRVLDELLVDNLAKGGPLRRAINDSSRKAKRGRIGGRL